MCCHSKFKVNSICEFLFAFYIMTLISRNFLRKLMLKFWRTFNPLRTTVIQKLLEIIGIVRLCPSCSFATALDSDIIQTTGTGGVLSRWENRCVHAAVCLLRAGQPRSAGDAAKLGSIHRSILVGHRRPNRPHGVNITAYRPNLTFRTSILLSIIYYKSYHMRYMHSAYSA